MKLARGRPHIRWLLASTVLIAATTLTIWMLVVMPFRHRSQVLEDLTSMNGSNRQWALNELIQHASNDKQLLSGALACMSKADPLNILQLLNALRLGEVLGDLRVLQAAMQCMTHADLEYFGKYYGLFCDARIGNHPLMLEVLVERLNNENDEAFLSVVGMLKSINQWRHPPVPVSAYLRWLGLAGDAPDAATRLLAVEQASEMLNLANEHDLFMLYAAWFEDPDYRIRDAALMGLAQLAGIARKPKKIISLIIYATGDRATEVAQRAWILLGLLSAVDQTVIKQLDPRIVVAESTIWALNAQCNNWDANLKYVGNGPHYRRLISMQTYAASRWLQQGAEKVIGQWLEAILSELTSHTADRATQIMVWRLLLSLREIAPDPDRFIQSLYDRCKGFDADDPILGPLAVIATYCNPVGPASGQASLQYEANHLLAVVEAQPINRQVIRVEPDAPLILRIMAVRATRNPDPNDLMPGFRSSNAAYRDLSCVIADERFTPPQHAQLVKRLLMDYSDQAKQSGAILAGLTGEHKALLYQKMVNEDIWPIKQIHRLGIWMQGDTIADKNGKPIVMRDLTQALLARDDLSISTVYLAILQKHGQTIPVCPSEPAAMVFNTLLNPSRTHPSELAHFLAIYRWHHVLYRFLPTDAPPFWVWADEALQLFQVQILQNWYLLHRHKPPAAMTSNIGACFDSNG